VDGVEYGTEIKAARGTGLSVSTVHDALKAGGRAVKGRMILPERPPKPCAAEIAAAEKEPETEPPGRWGRIRLLRYPPGEGPLYQGSRHWK
jgi:hypothetical protein